MHGLWVFLTVAVIFGSLSSVIRAGLRRGGSRADARELADLRARVAELEGQVGTRPALPPHDIKRVGELESRIESLETIVTGADELLEKRLRDAARQVADKDT